MKSQFLKYCYLRYDNQDKIIDTANLPHIDGYLRSRKASNG
jgi:hypothetical protein